MPSDFDEPISPTFEKVLQKFKCALEADEGVEEVSIARLHALLQVGKVPKSEEIEEALFSAVDGGSGGRRHDQD